ncbi:MAG: hypothetical protein EZS28_041674 [Streblomastix strix]|uniref:Uncharacterized protein n=1 Tax=Streblomastix strix TaxID=222440 RepID=A0A5J4TY35_9EUKA|nr:MAG: hypothetical protein EZS28_041674 [Streblomastix strix]
MLDKNIQQLLIGKPLREMLTLIYTQILHDMDRDYRKNYLDLGRGRKSKRVISSEGSENGQNNRDLAEVVYKEPHCPMELKLKNNGKTIVDIINRDKK